MSDNAMSLTADPDVHASGLVEDPNDFQEFATALRARLLPLGEQERRRLYQLLLAILPG